MLVGLAVGFLAASSCSRPTTVDWIKTIERNGVATDSDVSRAFDVATSTASAADKARALGVLSTHIDAQRMRTIVIPALAASTDAVMFKERLEVTFVVANELQRKQSNASEFVYPPELGGDYRRYDDPNERSRIASSWLSWLGRLERKSD